MLLLDIPGTLLSHLVFKLGNCILYNVVPCLSIVCLLVQIDYSFNQSINQQNVLYKALFTSAFVTKCFTDTQSKTPESKQCRGRSTVARKKQSSSGDLGATLFYIHKLIRTIYFYGNLLHSISKPKPFHIIIPTCMQCCDTNTQ